MISANNELTPEIEYYLVGGIIPTEFRNIGETRLERLENATKYLHKEDTYTCSIFRVLLNVAEEQLRIHLRAGGSPDKKISKNIYMFEMKHNWRLTKSMYEAGWRQWASTVTTETEENIEGECAAFGLKKKNYRITTHFWVSPNDEIILGKIKLKDFRPGRLLNIDNDMCDMALRGTNL